MRNKEKWDGYEELIELLEHDDLTNAFNAIAQFKSKLTQDINQEITLLKSRFSRLNSQIGDGIISTDQQDLERNRIKHSLSELINDFPHHVIQFKVKPVIKSRNAFNAFLKKNKTRILLVLWLFILTGLIFSLSIKKKGIKVGFSLLTDAIRFEVLENTEFELANDYDGVSIIGIEEFSLSGSKIQNENGFQELVDNRIYLKGIHELENSVFLEDIQMDGLDVQVNSSLLFEIPEEDIDIFSITVNNGNISSSISYWDSLYFSCNHCVIGNDSFPLFESYLYGPQGTNVQFPFDLETTISTIILELADEKEVFLDQVSEIKINNLAFEKPKNSKTQSSILSGKLSFLTDEDLLYHDFGLDEGNYFQMIEPSDLVLTNIKVRENKIEISGLGNCKLLRAGLLRNEMKNINPSLFSYLSHNHLTFLLVFCAFILSSTVLLIKI